MRFDLYRDKMLAIGQNENGNYLIEFMTKKSGRRTPCNRIWTKIIDIDGGCLLMSKNWYLLKLKIPRRFGLKPLLENAENAVGLIRKELPLWCNGDIYGRKKIAKKAAKSNKFSA